MSISSEPTNGTEEAVAAIMAAIKRFVELMAEKADTLIAAAVPDEEWSALVREGIAPHLGAEFIATAAASLPPAGKRPRSMSDRIRQTDGLLAWPEGVEGPSTVQALLDEYPSTFSGINADDVRIVISSPSWTQKFNTYMRDSINLVEGMSDTVFADMQAALSKVGQGATSFDKQKVVREALSWEEEGGYVGWMRRAETIARTETAVARNSAAHAAALETASSGIPVSKRWVAAADERTRPDHAAAHGTLRDVHEAFDVGGEPLQFPGDREHGSAGQTINCRCVCTYLEDFTAQEAEDFNRELDEWDDISLEELERQMNEELNGVTASGDVQAKAWAGQLAPRGEPTGDGRIFTGDGDFRFREFPLPLLWQESTGEGHDASRVVGTIDRGEITDEGFMAEGTVFADEEKVLALLERGVIRPSVDLCDMVADVFAAEDDEDGQEMLHVTSATVMAATLVAKPAFENVNVTLTGEDATAEVDSLAASAGVALSTYDATMFDDPGLDAPTPLTVTDDGRVVGHLALWDSCHVGMPGRCVKPPKSASGYASFHQSTVRTDRGNLAVGRLTVGGGHASPRDGFRAAAEHYDTTGAAWAMVRAGEDKFGIWVAGQVHPDATAAQVNAGASAPLSGDWRRIGGGMELVAALSVSTPGFPVRREYTSEQGDSMSLVAAAEVSADHHGGVLPGKESDPNDVSGAYKAMAEYAKRKAHEWDPFSDLEKTPIGWRRKEQNMAVNVSALTDEQADALAARLAPHIDKHNSRQSARVRAKKAEAALRSEKRERTLRRAEQVFGSKTGGEK